MAAVVKSASTSTSLLKKSSKVPYLLLAPGLFWLTLFFVAPIATLITTSTKVPGFGIGEFEQGWRWANYLDALTGSLPQFTRSFGYAFIATVMALAIAYPLAYGIAFKSGKYKNLLLVLVVAPFFCSFILRTIAWKQILGSDGPIFSILRAMGAVGPTAHLTATAPAVIAGLTYNFLPFMTLPLYSSLERIDPRVLEASGDLYANTFTTFRKVTLPLSMPGVVAGTLLTFIPAAGDYVNAEILGNPKTKMIGNVINAQFLNTLNYPLAASLSFILMFTILIAVMVYIRRAGTEDLV